MKNKLTIIISVFIICALSIWIYEYDLNYPKARIINCSSNLKQIALALKMYSMDNNGYFPQEDGIKGLELLRKNDYLSNLRCYQCVMKLEKKGKHRYRCVLGLTFLLDEEIIDDHKPLTDELVDFQYKGGLKTSDQEDTAVAWHKPDFHTEYQYVLFVNGNVETIPRKEWIKLDNTLR